MKTFLLLILISFQAMAEVNPKVVNSVDEKKTIHVRVTNESVNPIHCKWKVSWFESLLSFKQFYGDLDISPNATEELEFTNDPYSKVYKLKSQFKCL